MDNTFVDLAKQELLQMEEQLRQIRKEKEIIKAQAAEKLKALDAEDKHLEAQALHLRALISPEEYRVSDDNPQKASEPIGKSSAIQSAVRRNSGLADQVYELLSETGKEFHYKELVYTLESRGIKVSGKDPGLNLIAHIHDDNRFVRPKRGVYGLKEWYSKNLRSVGARKRKRAKRTKSASETQIRRGEP